MPCCLKGVFERGSRNLARRIFAERMPWKRAFLLTSGVLCSFCFRMSAMEGWTLAIAVAMSNAVSLRVVSG